MKISQYYDFGWKQNRSLSFQFPKLYAIQMPAEWSISKNKRRKCDWERKKKRMREGKNRYIQTTTAIYLRSIIIIFLDSLREPLQNTVYVLQIEIVKLLHSYVVNKTLVALF